VSSRTFSSLQRHRNYRLYFGGQVISLSGSWMQDAALPWLVFELTHSATQVALITLCRLGPSTLFSLFTGVLADRFDNRRLMMLSQTAIIVPTALMGILTLAGVVELWQLYALTLVVGLALVVEAPARQSLVYQLVGRQDLPNAVALNSSLVNLARIIGPATGGVIIATAGVGWCFVINAISILAVLTVLLAMRLDELFPLERAAERPTLLGGFREALDYVWRTPQLRTILLLLAAVTMVGFNVRVLLPVLSSKTLDASPQVFGLLYAVFGLGAIGGTFFSATRARPTPGIVLGSSAVLSSAMLLLAPVRSVQLAAVLLLVMGAGWALWFTNTNGYIQLAAPQAQRGRILGFMIFAAVGMQPVGGLISGAMIDAGGTDLAFLVSGSVVAAVSLVALRSFVASGTLRAQPEAPAA
jgi:MFS family permease